MLVCPALLHELRLVLARPKFRRYVTEEEAEGYVDMLERSAVVLEDPAEVERRTPDPGDDYLVAFASLTGANALVSGDPHLTGLGASQPPVLTPRQFAERLARRE